MLRPLHWSTIKNWLWPQDCVFCHARVLRDIAICLDCEKDLPWNNQACYQCGAVLSSLSKTSHCGACLATPPPFQKTIALFKYQTPIMKLITQLKFQQKLIYARLLGELLSKKISTENRENLPEFIIPIPLHTKRQRQRGFNQALEVSKVLSTRLNIPLDFKSCNRIKNTAAQSSLPAKQRHQNIKKAFNIKRPIKAKHVAIIDDVMTTGQTVLELSKVLKKQGVEKIEVWCCARA